MCVCEPVCVCVSLCVCVRSRARTCSVVSNSCDPVDCSPPGSSAHGILQARRLEWGCRFLLQGTFPARAPDAGLPHLQAGSLSLSLQGRPFFRCARANATLCFKNFLG